MRIPFFLMRFAMAAAVLAVIGLVIWLLMQEDKRDVVDRPDSQGNTPSNPVQSTTPTSGSINELLIELNRLPPPPKDSPYIVQATRLQDRLTTYKKLVEKIDELDEATAIVVKRGVLGTLYQLHSINRFERVNDNSVHNELLSYIGQLENDEVEELRRTAAVTKAAMSLLDLFDHDPQNGEIEKATTAIDRLVADFPSNRETYATLYVLISDYGTEKNAYSETTTLLKHVNEHALNSSNEEIVLLGKTYLGRVLLIENDVLSLSGRLDLKTGSDEEQLVRNLQNFFAEGHPLSIQIAEAIGEIGNGLEKLQKNESAITVYQLLDERVRSDKKLESAAKITADGLKRLKAAGQKVEFPDLAAGQHNLVLFVADNPDSKRSIREMANLRILNSRTKLQLTLVSFEKDPEPIREYLDDNKFRELKFVSDPEKTSNYFRSYPAIFFPTVIIVDEQGTILDVNVNKKRLQELLDDISETS